MGRSNFSNWNTDRYYSKEILAGTNTFSAIIFKYAFITAIFSLGIGMFFTIKALYPRSGYRSLGSLKKWKTWRDDYYNILTETEPEDEDGNRSALEDESLKAFIEEVIEITTINGKINECRMVAFKRSFLFTSVAMLSVFIQGLLYVFLI